MKNLYIFTLNKTCHGSHPNTAPGQVFAFPEQLLNDLGVICVKKFCKFLR